MRKLKCPHCKEPGIAVWKCIFLGEKTKAVCSLCNKAASRESMGGPESFILFAPFILLIALDGFLSGKALATLLIVTVPIALVAYTCLVKEEGLVSVESDENKFMNASVIVNILAVGAVLFVLHYLWFIRE